MSEFVPTRHATAGDNLPSRLIGPATREMFVRYAGASGDFNPIHWDQEFARAAGYGDVFAMGMLPAGILAGFLTEWFGHESVKDLRVRFASQTWPGEALACHGAVVSVDTDAYNEAWASCEVRIENDAGDVKIRGWAQCRVLGE